MKRLREAENDEDDDESAFVMLGKYKKRILQIHSRIAKLQGPNSIDTILARD